jgi:broad specificity phosphatase PhoE
MAPVWITALIGLLGLAWVYNLWRNQSTTTIIALRHAEKQLGTIEDPPLALEGERRALALAQMFATGKPLGTVEAIFVSDTRRARDTAAPLAARLGLTPMTRDPADVEALVGEILDQYRGRVVMVVGHSNTVPALIAELSDGRVQVAIGENDYGQLFAVSRPSYGPAGLLQMRY